MARVRDLTEMINNRPSKAYIGEALRVSWNLRGRFEREEADALGERLRRGSRAERTLRYGLRTA
jgi:hypothetical protein